MNTHGYNLTPESTAILPKGFVYFIYVSVINHFGVSYSHFVSVIFIYEFVFSFLCDL